MSAEAAEHLETGAFHLPKPLLRRTGKAMADYAMIREGDRVLLGLSGGKDSLSLLHLLQHFQRRAPIDFAFGAMTVDPQVSGYDPSSLDRYLERLGIPYHYESEPIEALAHEHMRGGSFCAFCSRLKRGIMYRTAREHGYNVLALAQHLDDLAESFLMSAFHGGQLRTMKAHYRNHDGDIRIIRPLIYVRERQLADFAQVAALPVIPDSCPACFAHPTEREHAKSLLAAEEARHPHLFRNLLTTLKPLMTEGGIPS